MITSKNLLFSTFIGLNVEIANSTQRNLIGINGMIVDETKNTLDILLRDGREIKIPKVSCKFKFTTESGETVHVEGMDIRFRPHERPKKV